MFEEVLNGVYQTNEYPVLGYLAKQWATKKPFVGKRILVATPVFRNTLLEYAALIAGGADLSIGCDTVACDITIVKKVKQWGFSVLTQADVLNQEQNGQFFDLILDCAGQFSACHPAYGFVELTRSGVYLYEKSSKPVFVADSGIIKRIETSLGTGDGYFRALKQLGFSPFEGKKLLVFGSGKVGSGIALQGLTKGCSVKVVTQKRPQTVDGLQVDFSEDMSKQGIQIVDAQNITETTNAINHADFIVTATGKKDALNKPDIVSAIMESRAIAANMGVEDEYGEHIPQNRVLNNKNTFNFLLEEPTHLKYIDASLGLHAALGEKLIQEKCNFNGVKNPPAKLEQQILDITIQNGCIGEELQKFLM